MPDFKPKKCRKKVGLGDVVGDVLTLSLTGLFKDIRTLLRTEFKKSCLNLF